MNLAKSIKLVGKELGESGNRGDTSHPASSVNDPVPE